MTAAMEEIMEMATALAPAGGGEGVAVANVAARRP